VGVAVALLLGLFPLPARAQFPAELTGRVIDSGTGTPVPGAYVELASGGSLLRTTTDGSGHFRLRGLEEGRVRVSVRALGYHDGSADAELRNGEVARVVIELSADPLRLPGVTADRPGHGGGAGELRLDRGALVGRGARTAADALEGLPGVVVRRDGPGGAQTVSLRGGAPSGVLVLLDGLPLNDPLTGEADLSLVPAALLESVTVLPGSRSARFGGRAESGVVLLESRAAGAPAEFALTVGSLGEARIGGTLPLRTPDGTEGAPSLAVSLIGEFARLHGRFPFELPERIGGGAGERTNGDLQQASLTASLAGSAGGGRLRIRAGGEGLERGLPGRSYAPATSARQELRRGHAALEWRRTGTPARVTCPVVGASAAAACAPGLQPPLPPTVGVALLLAGRRDRLDARDPRPPLGLPYDTRVELSSLRMGVELDRVTPLPFLPVVALLLAAERQAVEAGSLSELAPAARIEAGGGVHLRLGPPGAPVQGNAALRADRDPRRGEWIASHELSGSLARGPASLRFAHRSGFSPPSLADQYFREGVGVAPNPALRPQRVPAEVEAGGALRLAGRGFLFEADATAHRGRVRDLIVWLPDYRFVWSPRNVDVERSGGEVSLRTEHSASGIHVEGQWSRARIVYDRGPGRDTVQVAYRPRHTAAFGAGWARSPWRVGTRVRFIGTRYPVPSPINALPPFWTIGLEASRDWAALGWRGSVQLQVDRAFDEKDSLIFAVPEPGRTLRLGLRMAPGRGFAPPAGQL